MPDKAVSSPNEFSDAYLNTICLSIFYILFIYPKDKITLF